ncbi:Vacuolar protein sorting-associated protein 29 [Entamoeba marina]
MNKPYIIGVTGSICSGKTRLCRYMEEKGITIIDSDSVGHEVLIVGIDGLIDRKVLGQMVFGSKRNMNDLNDIMWKQIEDKILEMIQEHHQKGVKIIAVEAAMLIKTTWLRWINEVWVTTVSPNIAIERMMASRGLSKTDCLKRIQSQPNSRIYARFATFCALGNLCGKETYDTLRTLARDVHVVKGDFDEMEGLNESEVITLGNFKIGLIHGHQVIPWGDQEALAIYQRQLDVDILISGHTHQLSTNQVNGKYFLNPGSATGAYSPLVADQVPSFMLLEINDSDLSIYEYTLSLMVMLNVSKCKPSQMKQHLSNLLLTIYLNTNFLIMNCICLNW